MPETIAVDYNPFVEEAPSIRKEAEPFIEDTVAVDYDPFKDVSRETFESPFRQPELSGYEVDRRGSVFEEEDAKRAFSTWGDAMSSFDEPEKVGDKAVQSLVDAEIFKMPPSSAFQMAGSIDALIEKHQGTAARRGTLLEKGKQRWGVGRAMVARGKLASDFVFTGDFESIKKAQAISMPTEEETYDPESLFEEAVMSAAELFPMTLEAAKDGSYAGVVLAAGFGLTAALAGQPELAPPAAIAGAKVGMTAYGLKTIWEIEAGNTVLELFEMEDKEGNKLHPNIVRGAAFGYGTLSTALEASGIKILLKTIPGAKNLFKKAAFETMTSKTVKRKILDLGLLYAGTVEKETGIELAQESTNIVVEEMAKALNNLLEGTDFDRTKVQAVMDRLKETGRKSALGFAVIAAPGVVMQAGGVVAETRAQARRRAGTRAELDKLRVERKEETVEAVTESLIVNEDMAEPEAKIEAVKRVDAVERIQKTFEQADVIPEQEAYENAAIDLVSEGVAVEDLTDEMIEAKVRTPVEEVTPEIVEGIKDFDELGTIAYDFLAEHGYPLKSGSAQSNSLYFENEEGHLIRVSDHPAGVSGRTLFATPDQSLEYKKMPTADELIRDLGEAMRDEFYIKTVEREETFRKREQERHTQAVEAGKPQEDFYIEYLNKTNPGEYEKASGRKRKNLRRKAAIAWEKIQKAAEPKRLITDEVYQAAKARVDEKLKGLKTGIDPTVLPDLAIMGAYHMETGLKTFSEWSKKMVEEHGDKIKPQLKAIWKGSNAYLKAQVPKKEVKGVVRKTTGQITDIDMKRLNDTLKDTERVARQAYKAGDKEGYARAQKEITQIKESMKGRIRRTTGIVKINKMIREDKALAASFKKAEQASKIAFREGKKEAVAMERARMKDIIAEARGRIKDTATINKLKGSILKEIKTAKVKKVSGKPRGKFTADVQAVLDKLTQSIKLTQDEALKRIENNLEAYMGRAAPAEVILENRVLDMVSKLFPIDEESNFPIRKRFTPEELKSLLQEVKDLKNEGRMLSFLGKLDRSERDRAAVDTSLDVITGGKGLPSGLETVGVKEVKLSKKELSAWVKQFPSNLGVHFVGWNDLMDMLSARDPSEPGKSRLSELAEVHNAENAEKSGNRIATDKINEMALEAFGLKTSSELIAQFNIDAKEMELGSFENADGVRNDLVITKAEARKFMMEYADPSLRETFSLGMKYTDDMVAAIKRTFTAQDRAFMSQQMNFYRDYYDRVNEVYRDIYGVDLPFNEFYTPIQREGVSATEGIYGEFLDEVSYRRSVTSGSLKSRVKNVSRIAQRSDVNVLERHIADMEHFIAWSERISELNAIFKNQDVRAAIKLHHGKTMLKVIDKKINDFTRGGIETSSRLKALDKIRGNFTRSVLGAKLNIAAKQFTSTVAYAEVMPVVDFTKGMASFWAHPVENFNFLKENSVWFKERSVGTTSRDLKTAMKMREYSSFRKGRGFFDLLMLNVAIGDQGAIAAGGWVYYKYLVDKKGMSHKNAILEFEKFSEMTQQSSDLSIQSHIQNLGSFAKLFTMFLSASNLYMRKELGAARNLIVGRGSIRGHIKTLVIYHIVLPMFFQWVSDGFDWDEDEQLRAVITGPLNGIFIAGDLIDAVIRKSLGLRVYDKQVAIYSGGDDLNTFISEAIEGIAEGEMTDEEFFRAIRGLAGGVGAFTGLPLKQAVDQLKTGENFVDGEYEKALKGVLGYSPYMLDKKKEEKWTVQ